MSPTRQHAIDHDRETNRSRDQMRVRNSNKTSEHVPATRRDASADDK